MGGLLGDLIDYFRRKTRPVTPAEADRLIRDRYDANLTAAMAAGTQVQGVIQVVDDAKFRTAYAAYFGSIDADYPFTHAFVDRSATPPTVWIHQERQTPTTVLHEALHIYSNPALRTTYGSTINEGVTEYFTRRIVQQQNLPPRTGLYDNEYEEVRALIDVSGENALRRAYFEGNLAGLQTAVDNARGAGTFANWVARMQADDWAGARATLAPPT